MMITSSVTTMEVEAEAEAILGVGIVFVVELVIGSICLCWRRLCSGYSGETGVDHRVVSYFNDSV